MTAWQVPDGLGGPPEDASLPRLVSGAHPKAVGSYAPDMLAWCEARPLNSRRTQGWRWWQRYVAWRALEHDEAGRLVWDRVIVSTRRQAGKSWLERGTLSWRLHQAGRFGEEQAILHVAHKLVAAQEVWRPAARWAVGEYGRTSVRWANGEQQIEIPREGSRWMIQAASDGAGVAFSLSMALVDEAWRVPLQVVDGAIAPTLAEAESPQLWLVSTAGISTSELMSTNRAAALATAELDDPGSTLIVEWSAPPDPELDIDNPQVWRAASPYWDDRIAERIARERGRCSEFQFRQQWLNQWVPTVSSPLIDRAGWEATAVLDGPQGRPCFGFDVAPDRSTAAVVACGAGRVEVVRADDGVAWLEAEIRRLVDTWDPPRVAADMLGPSVTAIEALTADLGDRLVVTRGRDLVAACGGFYDQIRSGWPTHRPHPLLDVAAARARKRPLSSSWVFDRADGGHVLVAACLAHWADRSERLQGPQEAPAVFA